MSLRSSRITRRLQRFRNRNGENVLFNGVSYKCFVEEVSSVHAGAHALNYGTFGIYEAAAVPSIFDFNPLDFYPNTTVQPPKESDQLTRNSLIFVVTAIDYSNEDTDTDGLWVYALRKIWATP